MNYDQPAPRTNWVKVVLFILGGLALLFAIFIFSAYYVVMHTAVPFKMVASVITEAGTNQNLKIDGISGSISKGFMVKSITWGEKDKDANQIQDVRLLYTSFWDIIGGQKIIFKEVHVGKAHLDVTGIEELMSRTNSVDEDMDDIEDPTDTNTVAQPNAPPAAWTNSPVWRTRSSHQRMHRPSNQLIQVDKFSIEDVFLTNRVTGFSLSVPAIQWKGFKALGDNVELGELTIDSDRLKVETKPGETVQVNGQPIKFQKKLEGTILPALHKSVRQPLAFTFDAVHDGTNFIWRLSSLEGKVEAYQAGDEGGFLRCKDADLKAYFDTPVPEHLTAEALMTHKGAKEIVKLQKGSFNLGLSRFEIQPREWEKTVMPSTNHLTAVSKAGTSVITYHLFIPDQPWNIEQTLTAQPPMKPDELLAKVYYGKTFATLNDTERKSIEAKKAAFSGWAKEARNVAPKSNEEKPELETQKP